MKLVGKKTFAAIAFNLDNRIFVIHISSVIRSDLYLKIHFSRRSQITSLKADETSTSVASNYIDFIDIFSKDLIVKLLKYTQINNYAIDLVEY